MDSGVGSGVCDVLSQLTQDGTRQAVRCRMKEGDGRDSAVVHLCSDKRFHRLFAVAEGHEASVR